ncbi:hypothetical protein JW921_07535 [Candidatus Fermentibacterales bacterium]|nr:hypothetical protein [Candidatus Fermentibacterales bacterium]
MAVPLAAAMALLLAGIVGYRAHLARTGRLIAELERLSGELRAPEGSGYPLDAEARRRIAERESAWRRTVLLSYGSAIAMLLALAVLFGDPDSALGDGTRSSIALAYPVIALLGLVMMLNLLRWSVPVVEARLGPTGLRPGAPASITEGIAMGLAGSSSKWQAVSRLEGTRSGRKLSSSLSFVPGSGLGLRSSMEIRTEMEVELPRFTCGGSGQRLEFGPCAAHIASACSRHGIGPGSRQISSDGSRLILVRKIGARQSRRLGLPVIQQLLDVRLAEAIALSSPLSGQPAPDGLAMSGHPVLHYP